MGKPTITHKLKPELEGGMLEEYVHVWIYTADLEVISRKDPTTSWGRASWGWSPTQRPQEAPQRPQERPMRLPGV